MNVTFSTNVEEWTRQIAAYMGAFRVDKATALRTQGRLLGERLIRMTPPKTRAQGRRRVGADIERLFLGMRPESIAKALEAGRGARVVEQDDSAPMRLWVTKDQRVYGVERRLYRPDASLEEMGAHHQKNRDRRGRVSRAGTETRDIGRWRFLDQMVVTDDTLEEYKGTRRDLVGQAKGGWARATATLGGRVASWISQHGYAGRMTDRLNEPAGFLQLDNASEWARGGFNLEGESLRIANAALASRARDIEKSIAKAEADAQRKAFRRGQAIAKLLN